MEDKSIIKILSLLCIVFLLSFLYSYNFNWTYGKNLPKIVFENEHKIHLQIDSKDYGEYFHRKYSHNYPESTFDYYLLDGKSYHIGELSVSKGCYSGEDFLWKKCLHFITLDKNIKTLSFDEFLKINNANKHKTEVENDK